MYETHVPLIREHATASPQGLADVLAFVLVTIRHPFRRVPDAMKDVRANGAEAHSLWGWKREGYEWLRDNAEWLHDRVRELDDPETTIDLVDLFAAHVPGLAIVKAAFAAQMLGHDVACMDSRNLEALGYEAAARPFREFKRVNGVCTVSEATRHRRISEYVDATRASGGAAYWWNNWCNGIAPSLGTTGDDISGRHWDCIRRGAGFR